MLVIGERINGMFDAVGKAIANKDKEVIQNLAKQQVNAGADMLDVNTGPAAANQVDVMKWLVETIQEAVEVPLSLDSTKPEVIKAGLNLVKKKALINSTTADPEKMDILIPIAKEYKAGLIGLTMDKKGIPRDMSQRSEFAAQIVTTCQDMGLDLDDLYLDPVILPVNMTQPHAVEVLEAIREIRLLSTPPPKMLVGLSNISQGAKERSLINRTFLAMAIGIGLDAAIMDPLDKDLMNAMITAELLMNKNIYCDSYLEAYRRK